MLFRGSFLEAVPFSRQLQPLPHQQRRLRCRFRFGAKNLWTVTNDQLQVVFATFRFYCNISYYLYYLLFILSFADEELISVRSFAFCSRNIISRPFVLPPARLFSSIGW
jgi:hypothetical protein